MSLTGIGVIGDAGPLKVRNIVLEHIEQTPLHDMFYSTKLRQCGRGA
jgi:hypothetical protein